MQARSTNGKKAKQQHIPILIMEYHRVSWHICPIIISVPVVDSMGSVLDFQNGMSITGFSKCRIVRLWIPKPVNQLWPLELQYYQKDALFISNLQENP